MTEFENIAAFEMTVFTFASCQWKARPVSLHDRRAAAMERLPWEIMGPTADFTPTTGFSPLSDIAVRDPRRIISVNMVVAFTAKNHLIELNFIAPAAQWSMKHAGAGKTKDVISKLY